MAARLLDSNGNLKPFEQWRDEVLPIASHQCHNWLQTEYNTAVLRAHQAQQWQQFQAEKDILPNLKWLPSTSPNPGADHQPFWNTILPIDHPFWDNHRPGDRWNCKCDLTSTDEPPTPVPNTSPATVPGSSAAGSPEGGVPTPAPSVDPHPGLTGNPGKTQAIFSDDHPYFPSDCRHCSFYNPTIKAQLSTIFKARLKDCFNCPYIDGCIEGAVKVNRKAAEHIRNIRNQIDPFQGMLLKSDSYLTGQLRILRRSLKDIMEHNKEDAILMQWLSELSFSDLKHFTYEGWAENRPYKPDHPKYDPKDPGRKKHHETEYFIYYSIQIGGKKYWANVKMHKDYSGEVLYTIEPKEPEDLRKGRR